MELIRNILFPACQHEEEDIGNIKLEENPSETVALPELLNLSGRETRGDRESRQLPAALSGTQIPPPPISSSLEDIMMQPTHQFQIDDAMVRLLLLFMMS